MSCAKCDQYLHQGRDEGFSYKNFQPTQCKNTLPFLLSSNWSVVRLQAHRPALLQLNPMLPELSSHNPAADLRIGCCGPRDGVNCKLVSWQAASLTVYSQDLHAWRHSRPHPDSNDVPAVAA